MGMQFYDLTTEHIPLEKQPSFILSVETELGIQAGLQDRVVQAYGGLVYMDFDAEYMKAHGHGRYEPLSAEALGWLSSLPLFIAYEADPSDSGKIHSNVRARWDAKDPVVIKAMQRFVELTVSAKEAFERQDHKALCDLMDENFSERLKLYGEECLGKQNMKMIEICQRVGAAAKFPGSGGAVLGLCRPLPPSEETARVSEVAARQQQLDEVREALEVANFVFCALDPVMPQ